MRKSREKRRVLGGIWFCSGRSGLHCWVGYVERAVIHRLKQALQNKEGEDHRALFACTDGSGEDAEDLHTALTGLGRVGDFEFSRANRSRQSW